MNIPDRPTWPLQVATYFAGAFIFSLLGFSLIQSFPRESLPPWFSLAIILVWWGAAFGCAGLTPLAWQMEKRRLAKLRAALAVKDF
ncbi:MAG TPA: hypothetical protein VKB71_04560 [Rhizomicrobium sp.]|nr:hypothetical protein [Rhizomicrobium sp.]